MSAHIQSTDAIERLRLAVLKFAEQCELGLEEVDAETRRMLDWIEDDRPKFWREQIHRASDDVHQAKINLERCLRLTVAQDRPSCQEERAALRKAQERLTYCRDKAERVKHWSRELQHELLEYQGRIGQLSSCTEHDLPQAAARLKRVLEQIAAYQATATAGSGQAESMAHRGGGEEEPVDDSDSAGESASDSPQEADDEGSGE